MLLIPLLLCSSSSSVIKNEFKNGFDKQWTKNCFRLDYLVQSYSSVTHRYHRTISDFIFIEKPVLYFKRNYQPFETKDTNESNIFTRDHFLFQISKNTAD